MRNVIDYCLAIDLACGAEAQQLEQRKCLFKARGQTSSLSLHPRREQRSKIDRPPKVTGFEAVNMLRVQIRNLDHLPKLALTEFNPSVCARSTGNNSNSASGLPAGITKGQHAMCWPERYKFLVL